MLKSLHVLLLTSGIFLVAATVLTTTTLEASSPDIYVTSAASFNYLTSSLYAIAYEPNSSYIMVTGTGYNNIHKVTLGTWEVRTIAGSPFSYYNPGLVDGIGTYARFDHPWGMVWDASRTAYMICDSWNHNIRKMTSAVVVTTYAGSTAGTAGSVDGTTTTARFDNPRGIAVFGSTLVVADHVNGIRSISSSGYVSTLASSVINATAITTSSAYVYTNSGYSIVRIDSAGTVTIIAGSISYSEYAFDGDGTSARFNMPQGMTMLPDGSLLVSDLVYHVIRHINTSSYYVSTYAGSGWSRSDVDGYGNRGILNSPRGVQYLSTSIGDYLFVCTYGKLKSVIAAPVSAIGGYVETLTAYPTSTEMSIITPSGMAREPNSDYILITNAKGVHKLSIGTWSVTLFAGTTASFYYSGYIDGVGSSARFNYPHGIVWDASRTAFMIADSSNNNIRKMTTGASVTTYAGSTSATSGSVDGTTTYARFYNPVGIAVFGSTLVVADNTNNAIRSISSSGYVSTLASSVAGPSAITASSSYVYTDNGYSIVRIDAAGTVATIAGSASYSGYTNGYGTSARFGSSADLTMLPDGSLLVSSLSYDVIRHINTSSYYVSTYAGSGNDFDTDGYGKSASLNDPRGLEYFSIDGVGYVFVGTAFYIRRVGLNNTVTPTPVPAATTTTTPASPSTTTTTSAPSSSTTTPASLSTTSAGYVQTVASGLPEEMYGIAYEPGASYILITEIDHHTIKKVTLGTWDVTTFAGSTSGYMDGIGTSARFDHPWGMVWDATRTAYMIADSYNQNIRKMTSGANVSTYVGSTSATSGNVDGTTTSARFYNPTGIAVFGSTLVVADYYNNAIRSISSSGYVSTLASTISMPFGVTASSTYVYTNNGNSIVRIDASGSTTTIAGFATSQGYINGYGTSARLDFAQGMTLLPDGSMLVSDQRNDVIRHINTTSYYVSTYVGNGNESDTNGYGTNASLYNPRGLQYFSTSSGEYLFVSTFLKLRTIGDTSTGGATTAVPSSYDATPVPGTPPSSYTAAAGYVQTVATGLPYAMYGIAYEPNSSYILITETTNHTIKKVTLGTWSVSTFAGSTSGYIDGIGTSARFDHPWGTVWDASRTAFMIADYTNNNIRKMTSGANVSTFAGSTSGTSGSVDGNTTSARFYHPTGIAVFGSTLVVADYYNGIRSINSSGYVSTLASSVSHCWAITANSSYVYTNDGYSIVRIDSAGTTTTIAGSRLETGYINGYGTSARFGGGEGLTLLSDGSVLVSDQTHNVIRRIDPSSYYVSTYVGNGNESDTSGYGTSASLYGPRGLQYFSTSSGDYLFVCTAGQLRTIDLSTSTPIPEGAGNSTPTPGGAGNSTPTPTGVAGGTPSPLSGKAGFIPGTSEAGSTGIVVSLSLLVVICCIVIIVVIVCCLRKKPPPPKEKEPNVSPNDPYPEPDPEKVEMEAQPNFDPSYVPPEADV